MVCKRYTEYETCFSVERNKNILRVDAYGSIEEFRLLEHLPLIEVLKVSKILVDAAGPTEPFKIKFNPDLPHMIKFKVYENEDLTNGVTWCKWLEGETVLLGILNEEELFLYERL